MTDTEPTYDRVNIREMETHHRSNESIKVGNVATFQFERDKEIQKLIRVFIVVFTIFAVLLIVALIVIIMLHTERTSYTTPNVEFLQSQKCPQDEFNAPIPPQTMLKVYIDQQLKTQRRFIHQLSLRIDAHLFAPKQDIVDKNSNLTSSKQKNCCNFKDDIVGLKLANISLGHKSSANAINVEANRNKLTFLTKHVGLLNNELNQLKNSAVQNEMLRDISNLKVANLTMFSINYMNSIVMDKLTNQINMVEARITSLQNVLSLFSLKKIEHDLHMLKTSNLSLYNHISQTSNNVAKIDNKLVLLAAQVNANNADIALLKTLKDGAMQNNEIKKLIRAKLDEYDKKLQIFALKLSQMNVTRKKDSKKDLIIRKELGYCTINVPITACLPCSCIANDKLYNKYTCDCSNLPLKKDCRDYFENGYRIDGIYTILPNNFSTKIRVFCEHSNGGGWIVIQRRKNSNVGFYRNWNQYKDGFGDLGGSHYIGNEYISKLTHNKKHELRIELMSHTKNSFFAAYDTFSVKDEKLGYQLECGGYNGNAGDSFCSYHSGSKFSTLDMDNDEWSMGSCSENYRGGWWYKNCAHSNLNSHYYPTSSVCPIYTGMHWYSIGQSYSSLKETKMMIRRV